MKQKRQTGAGGMIQASHISSAQLTGRSGWQNDIQGIYSIYFSLLFILIYLNPHYYHLLKY